ncbi:hypothetical protein BJ742DRAFT_442084 [Cladochytrium replicatum]|nr:hypothetical protein BJ742DRAFT_442084 [Cladochytrium replicatum]
MSVAVAPTPAESRSVSLSNARSDSFKSIDLAPAAAEGENGPHERPVWKDGSQGGDKATLFVDGSDAPASAPLARTASRQRKKKAEKKKEEDEVSGEDWRCVHCGVRADETPLKRRGPDGKRNICNACYVRWRVKMERAERGTARPILQAGGPARPSSSAVSGQTRTGAYSYGSNSGAGDMYARRSSVKSASPAQAFEHQTVVPAQQYYPQQVIWRGNPDGSAVQTVHAQAAWNPYVFQPRDSLETGQVPPAQQIALNHYLSTSAGNRVVREVEEENCAVQYLIPNVDTGMAQFERYPTRVGQPVAIQIASVPFQHQYVQHPQYHGYAPRPVYIQQVDLQTVEGQAAETPGAIENKQQPAKTSPDTDTAMATTEASPSQREEEAKQNAEKVPIYMVQMRPGEQYEALSQRTVIRQVVDPSGQPVVQGRVVDGGTVEFSSYVLPAPPFTTSPRQVEQSVLVRGAPQIMPIWQHPQQVDTHKAHIMYHPQQFVQGQYPHIPGVALVDDRAVHRYIHPDAPADHQMYGRTYVDAAMAAVAGYHVSPEGVEQVHIGSRLGGMAATGMERGDAEREHITPLFVEPSFLSQRTERSSS